MYELDERPDGIDQISSTARESFALSFSDSSFIMQQF